MKVLILGGTGTMGSELSDILAADAGNEITIVSRRKNGRAGNRIYISGDAMCRSFVERLTRNKFDVVVDFMWHNVKSISNLLPVLLESTGQYFFLSSAAVYADSDTAINEESPRFIDLVSSHEANASHEYHIVKAMAENVVTKSQRGNWTVVRPHVTVGPSRIPICTWEMSTWLPCAANNIPLAVPVDALPHKTTIATGRQVARQIHSLFGKKAAFREIIQLGSETVRSWGDIVDICRKALSGQGITLDIHECQSGTIYKMLPQMESRFKCDRLLDRWFDMSKYKRISGDFVTDIEPPEEFLPKYISQAIQERHNVATIKDYEALVANLKIVGAPLRPSMFHGRERLACLLRQYGLSDRLTTCLAFPEKAFCQATALVRRGLQR